MIIAFDEFVEFAHWISVFARILEMLFPNIKRTRKEYVDVSGQFRLNNRDIYGHVNTFICGRIITNMYCVIFRNYRFDLSIESSENDKKYSTFAIFGSFQTKSKRKHQSSILYSLLDSIVSEML